MPLTPIQQGQLATLLAQADDTEIVRLLRLFYEAIQHHKVSTEKVVLLGKQMQSKVPWEQANVTCRITLFPVGQSVLERLPQIFDLVTPADDEPTPTDAEVVKVETQPEKNEETPKAEAQPTKAKAKNDQPKAATTAPVEPTDSKGKPKAEAQA